VLVVVIGHRQLSLFLSGRINNAGRAQRHAGLRLSGKTGGGEQQESCQ
jgi:hypothetical protein